MAEGELELEVPNSLGRLRGYQNDDAFIETEECTEESTTLGRTYPITITVSVHGVRLSMQFGVKLAIDWLAACRGSFQG